jgi:hypothetical protein
MKNNNDFLRKQFSGKKIFFINPDVKRGIGLEGILPDYHIICAFHDPLIPILRKQGANIFCLEEEIGEESSQILNNTGRMLENKNVLSYILNQTNSKPYIMYFKPSFKIDNLLQKHGFNTIGNNYLLNEKYENKISGFEFINKYFRNNSIPGRTGTFGLFDFKKMEEEFGLPLVVQFGHGWAGKTTFFIQDDLQFMKLKNKFIETNIKISKYISGFTVINNCTCFLEKVFISPPAIQISGISKINPNSAVTCGRQWPAKFISDKQINEINILSFKIGQLMGKSGYKGFFGLDFLIDSTTGQIYVSEINARLTASSAFYTKLEIGMNIFPQMGYHIASFITTDVLADSEIDYNIVGSQLILRLKSSLDKFNGLTKAGVYKIENNKIDFKRNEYFPEKLQNHEFNYSFRESFKKKSDDIEIARIETKDIILHKADKLTDYYNKLF